MHFAPPPLAILDFLGGGEIVLIFVVVLIFFGGEKLPEFARGFGKVMKEFKKAASEVEREFKNAMDEADRVKTDTTKAITPDLNLKFEAPPNAVPTPINSPSHYVPAQPEVPQVAPVVPPHPPAADGDAHIDA